MLNLTLEICFHCLCVGCIFVFLTLKCEAAASFEALGGFISLGSCSRPSECQEDSRLADELE